MQVTSEKAMLGYAQAYQKLYKRSPRDLRALDSNWVIVNGARIQVIELEFLTRRLEQEYNQLQQQKRNLVNRLVKWFRQ